MDKQEEIDEAFEHWFWAELSADDRPHYNCALTTWLASRKGLREKERIKELEDAIREHRSAVWGIGKIGHPYDERLYAHLKEGK